MKGGFGVLAALVEVGAAADAFCLGDGLRVGEGGEDDFTKDVLIDILWETYERESA